MGRSRALLAAWCAVALAAASGCGREEHESLPSACREGPGAVRDALRSAPGAVRVGGTPLSACLGGESDAGELRDVGSAFIETAAGLAAAAAERPEGREATQLGYLMGAVRRSGAASEGVNGELVRRLEQEVLALDTISPAFRRGERAGRRSG